MKAPQWSSAAAQEVVSICDEFGSAIEKIIRIAEIDLQSEEEIKEVRRVVGGLMSDLFLNLVLPISQKYPDIDTTSET